MNDNPTVPNIYLATLAYLPMQGPERDVDTNNDCVDELAESARYLKLRGLLERNEGSPHIVRVKEE